MYLFFSHYVFSCLHFHSMIKKKKARINKNQCVCFAKLNNEKTLAAKQVTTAKSQLATRMCIYHRFPSVRMQTRTLKNKNKCTHYKDVRDWINNAYYHELITASSSQSCRDF